MRTADELTVALTGVDLALTDEDCRTLTAGLELLKRRFQVFKGGGFHDIEQTCDGAYESLDKAVKAAELSATAIYPGYALVFDTLTSKDVWSTSQLAMG